MIQEMDKEIPCLVIWKSNQMNVNFLKFASFQCEHPFDNFIKV